VFTPTRSTDSNSLLSLLKLKPQSRTHTDETLLRSSTATTHALSNRHTTSQCPLSPRLPLTLTLGCRWYALRSLSLSLSPPPQKAAGGWRAGRLGHDHQRERREERGEASSLAVGSEAQNPPKDSQTRAGAGKPHKPPHQRHHHACVTRASGERGYYSESTSESDSSLPPSSLKDQCLAKTVADGGAAT
jgi:hypothetical protein